jgi:DNA polymerase
VLLRAALAEAGVPLEACYLTNAVKHFKWIERGKRRIHERPRPEEILACRMWLDEEMAAVKPALILALGVTSSIAVFGKAARIAKDRGKILAARDGTPAMVTAHPSSILRTPEPADRRAARARLVADLKRAYREALERRQRDRT